MLFAYELTAEHKADYLALIRDGYKPNVAAKELDSTGSQFRKHWSGNSEEYYDPDFAAAFHEALESEEHQRNLIRRVDDLVWEHAETNAQMALKLALVYHPDFEPLRHTNFNVNVQVEMLRRALPYLPQDVLEAAIRAEEESELRLLPPADVA